MGMSNPTTKAEAREQIANLQGKLERKKAELAYHKSQYKSAGAKAAQGNMMNDIAEIKAQIAKIKAKMSSLP